MKNVLEIFSKNKDGEYRQGRPLDTVAEVYNVCPHCGSENNTVYFTRKDYNIGIRFRYRVCRADDCGKRWISRAKFELPKPDPEYAREPVETESSSSISSS